MTEEVSTLNDLQKELKAADENMVERPGAFPMELMTVKNKEVLENNPIDHTPNGINHWDVNQTNDQAAEEETNKKRKFGDHDQDNDIDKSQSNSEENQKKKKIEEMKCKECQFKCYNTAEMTTHLVTSHRGKKRMKVCDNCAYSSDNTWEMDFHCRSRGHKVKKDDTIPCKKCDYMAVNKDDSWVHKKVHIPPEKLFECGDCVWCGDRLDNIRYHCHSQQHEMKLDYETIALKKAEGKGPKEVAQYKKKLAKDIKLATKALKA